MDIGISSGPNPVVIGSLILALLLFGVTFNWLFNELRQRGYTEGYTWLFVVAGVLVTLLAAGAVIGWLNALLVLLFFAASGAPMAFGDIAHHTQARRDFEERQQATRDGRDD